MTSQSHWKALFLTVLALTAIACITINVYFPEAAVRDLSVKIEDAVAREAAKIDPDSPAPADARDGDAAPEPPGEMAWRSTSGRLAAAVVATLIDATAADAAAQEVAAPEISNPAIRKIVDSRARRIAELNRHKASGVLGEGNDALVKIRAMGDLALRERAAVQKLVRDENADRERMFREIAAATNADLSQLGRIQTTYAETLREKAGKAEWIQLPDGTWRQK